MSALTEQEILDCLRTNALAAAADCDRLARGERGPVYVRLREELKLVEGCCRQMAHWREDARWLPWGLKMEEAHQRCGNWLRSKEPKWRFQGLAEILRGWLATSLHDIETKATGRVGAILPVVQAGPHRDTRPVAVNGMGTIKSSLIIPDGVVVH